MASVRKQELTDTPAQDPYGYELQNEGIKKFRSQMERQGATVDPNVYKFTDRILELQKQGYSSKDAGMRAHEDIYGNLGRMRNSRADIANYKLREGLRSNIADAPDQLREDKRLLLNESNNALAQGIKNTRENFNSRGMLYSGMRQGGEQSLRTKVASTLASGMRDATRDSDKAVTGYRQQLASVGLRSAQAAQEQAERTFESNMRNRVARIQAMQQLGEGVGYAAGAYYGSGSDADQPTGFTSQRRMP